VVKYNLILVDNPGLRSPNDFRAIKEIIEREAPDIQVFIVPNGHLSPVTARAAARHPTLVFCPDPIIGFRPRRGKVYQGRKIPKSAQVAALQAAGLPTPRSVELRPGVFLDPAEWGPFVVLKPEDAKQGQGVRLVRTRDAHWVDPRSWPQDDPRRGRQLVAQQFIDTGPHATSFRVMTVFGRPTYSLASIALTARPELDVDGASPVDLPIASNAGARKLVYNFDTEIIALGSAVRAAFPEVPVHGVDIVREVKSGALYVLEFNPGGFTWHLSSPYLAPHRREFGLDLLGQFDAIPTIARVMIEKTRSEAV